MATPSASAGASYVLSKFSGKNSCRESEGVVDVPRCVSRLSSPLPLEATREPQTASKDTLDVLVTDASLVNVIDRGRHEQCCVRRSPMAIVLDGGRCGCSDGLMTTPFRHRP